MHIFIDKFGGIIPRAPEHGLDITQATKAHNVRLRRNRIEAWREPMELKSTGFSTRSFYLHGCCPLFFKTVAHVANVSPDWGRLFVTGNADYPQIMEVDKDCVPTFSRLGVPAPTSVLHASAKENCSRASDARAYVYTYVNKWGEESAPSKVSNILTVDDGEGVTLTGFAQPPEGYNITTINLYRAVTALRAPNVKQQEYSTHFLWVGAFSATTSQYIDYTLMTEVGPVLETEKTHMPPTGLRNIVAFEDTVRLCGFVNNKLYFSEFFQVHNWPVKYELTLDDNIVHLGVSHGRLYVTTDSSPYVIDPTVSGSDQCASVRRFSAALPDIGCGYPHSSLATPYGFTYASSAGVVLLRPDASFQILTAPWFSPEDWKQLMPHTARFGIYQTYLFIITDKASFVLNLDRVTYGDLAGCELSTISDKPIDLVTSNTGELLFLENGKVWAWDMGDKYRPYFWESRELVGQDGIKSSITLGAARQNDARGVSWAPVSAKVHTDDTHFTVISPLQNPAYERQVMGEDWFRLPRMGRNLWYKIRFEGTRPVDFVAMGTSNFTLNQGK